jgi:TonB-dependent starch-binding outer membrane protein SusC
MKKIRITGKKIPTFWNKSLRLMKLTFLFLVVGLMQLSASVYSQSTKLSLDMRNAKVAEVLDAIESQSEFRFAYSPGYIDLNREVTVDIREKTIDESLKVVFAGTNVEFGVFDRHILLYPESLNPGTESIVSHATGAQQRTVSGTATDESGEPLPGVTVLIKGTTQGTVTNSDGNYSLPNIPEDATLQFSFVGMLTQEIEVGNQTTINVQMEADAIGIEEVVAIGYGTMRKSDLTGSVAQVKTEDLEAVPAYNMEQALKGRSAGVVVRQNSGAPGSRTEIRIRGGNSMIGNKEPLYVVDGFPITGDISFLNPSDIESVDILKDASATAIYGARGANGVVMITSKRGKSGQQSRIEVNSITGLQMEANRYDMLDAKQYAEVANEYLRNSGQEPYFNLNEVQNPGTNWQDLVLRNALLTNHTITFSGSTDKSNFSLSGNYYDQEGLIKYSDAKKGSLRLNLDHEFNKIISLGVNLNLSRQERNIHGVDNTVLGQSVLSGALAAPPTLTPYDENGNILRIGSEYMFHRSDASNPLIYFPPYKNRSLSNTVIGNLALNVAFTDELSLKSLFGLEYENGFGDRFSPIIFPNDRGSGSQSYKFQNSVLIENVLTYKKTISEKHDLNLIGGYTYQTFMNSGFGIGVSGFSNNTTENYNLGAAETIGNPSSGFSEWTLASWLGRVNYSFDNKYMLTASIRADGSSRFGANNKWGIFPSGAVAWRISEESFMENINTINSLKLRASYGVTGNTAIHPYESLNRLGSVKYVYGNQTEQIGFVPLGIPNPDLKWESTAQIDVGFDLSMLDNRFRVTFDYYKKNTSDLLSAVVLPPSSGFSTSIENIGEIENQGLELSIGADILRNEFKWDASASISGNKNKIVKLADGADIMGNRIHIFDRVTIAREGEPLQSFFGYRENGLDEQGNIKIVDLNNDGEITPLDNTIIGNPFPDFIFGFNSNFYYKQFELNFFIEGVYGNDIWWGTAGSHLNSFASNVNQFAELWGNYWTEENPDANAKYPKIQPSNRSMNTDRYVKDGSYLRLKSLRFAYNIPTDKVSWLGETQIFISGTNLLTITNYPGIDPDVNSLGSDSQGIGDRFSSGFLNLGIDMGSYPVSKVYSLGLKLNF